MTIYSHKTALDYWRSPTSSAFISAPRMTLNHLPTESGNLSLDSIAALGSHRLPLDTLIDSKEKRHRSKEMKTHAWSENLPPNALVKIAKSCYICSPEFCLLQMAPSSPLVEITRIGFEFCGSYVLDSSVDKGFQQRENLLSAKELAAFAAHEQSRRGSRKLARASRLIIDGSASPMETVVAMLLCLPCNLGGYGIPAPLMNEPLPVNGSAMAVSNRSFLACDFYWPEAHIGLEYDSDAFHTGSLRIQEDAKRRNELKFLGVDTITVTRSQVFSGIEMECVARIVAKALGRRLRSEYLGTTPARIALRKQLLPFAHPLA